MYVLAQKHTYALLAGGTLGLANICAKLTAVGFSATELGYTVLK